MEGLLDELQECVRSHESDVRLIGNLRAGDIGELLSFLRQKWDERDASVNDYLDCQMSIRDLRAALASSRERIERLEGALRLIATTPPCAPDCGCWSAFVMVNQARAALDPGKETRE